VFWGWIDTYTEGVVRFTYPVPDLVLSVTEVAVIPMLAPSVGPVSGDVYFPVPSIDPQSASVHTALMKLHVTPLFAESFWTVAVNCCVSPGPTTTKFGVTVTVIGAGGAGGTMDTDPLPVLAGLASELARI
jgi:hypothetical protein